MRIERFGAVGLDFDGTIANTRSAMSESRLEAFLSMAEELDDERYAQIDPAVHAEAHHNGTHPLEIIGWVMLQAGIIDDVSSERATIQAVVDRRNEIYWEKARHGFDEIPGAVETITWLSDILDGKLSIVTTAPLDEEVIPYLQRYGLLDIFDEKNLVTRHDVQALKPDPEAYRLSIERTGVDPTEYLALEDAHGGILSARLAKVGEVAALTTTHPVDFLEDLPEGEGPTVVTPTHDDFQKHFLLFENS